MFDFETLYQHYPTIDLLHIIQQPFLYQRAAVDAAQKILAQRNISDEEHNAATKVIAAQHEKAARPDWLQTGKERAANFITYLFTPSENFEAQKWLYWLCFAFVIHYVAHFANTFNWVWNVLVRCKSCSLDTYTAIILITWFYVPLMIALLFMRRKSGWMLAVFYTAVQAISLMTTMLGAWAYMNILTTDIIAIAIYSGACIFLRKREICDVFGVSSNLWGKVLLAAVGLSVTIWFIMALTA